MNEPRTQTNIRFLFLALSANISKTIGYKRQVLNIKLNLPVHDDRYMAVCSVHFGPDCKCISLFYMEMKIHENGTECIIFSG